MKVTKAYWEKRNLGLDTIEVEVEKQDTEKEIIGTLDSIKVPYSVVKISSEIPEMMQVVQSMGYCYAETLFALSCKVGDDVVPPMYKRFSNFLTTEVAGKELTDKVLREVKSGRIFSTDRIALDKNFSYEIAGRRYANWMKDEIEKEAEIYIVKYKGSPISFTVMKRIDIETFHSILGGVFEEATDKGLGFAGLQAINDIVISKGGKRIITHVSSNNLPILRLHLNFSYTITGAQNVFVRHII